MVCVLDFKRETGMWHSILASVLNGMHVIFIPYALMKVNPASWMQMITKHKGEFKHRHKNSLRIVEKNLLYLTKFVYCCSYGRCSQVARFALGIIGDQGS